MGIDKAASLGPSPIRLVKPEERAFSLPPRASGVTPIKAGAPPRSDQVSAFDEINGNRPVDRTFVPGVRVDSGLGPDGEKTIRRVTFTGNVDPATTYTVGVNSKVDATVTRAGDDGAISASLRLDPTLENGELVAPRPVLGIRATVGLPKEVGAFARIETDPNAEVTTGEVGLVFNPDGSAGRPDGQQRQKGLNVAIGGTEGPNGTSPYVALRSSLELGPGTLISDLKIPLGDETNKAPTGFVVYAIPSSAGALNFQLDLLPGEKKFGAYFTTGL